MRNTLVSGTIFALLGAVALWGCGGSTSTASTPAGAVAFGGCGGTTQPPPPPAAPSAPTPAPAPAPTPTTVTVSIVSATGNTAYRPNPVTANTGDSVMFRNNDSTLHHIVLDD